MSTLTRTNSHGKRPQYKDYVSFLDSYRNNKKDEHGNVVPSDSGVHVNFSLNNSNNTSSSSVFSDVSDGSNKLPPKAKRSVKTEMFIEIKNPPATQVFEVKRVDSPQESVMSVSSAAKMFERNDQNTIKKRQNSFKKHSIEEISKKFEKIGSSSNDVVDSVRPPVKRAPSIGEVSKIFENQHQQSRPKNFNAVPKPFQSTKINKPAISPKPVINAPAFPKFTPEPPRSYADSVDSALSSLSVSPSPPQCASPPPEGPGSPPPPPPPLPPSTTKLKPLNGTNQQIIVQTTGKPQSNSIVTPNGTLDRNDPRVKKAVYGALRNMYGTYHDQANDYLANLPKNRVKKNNGLDSIINSIASQGGLDKLSGRANPKQEVE